MEVSHHDRSFCWPSSRRRSQGLSVPLVIRALGLEEDEQTAREEAKARKYAAHAAIGGSPSLRGRTGSARTPSSGCGACTRSGARASRRLDGTDDGSVDERSAAYQRLRRELLEAERRAVVDLRRTGCIDDEVIHRIERDLDLEDVRLEI